ncbi:MAG: flagellar biosynthetic protein FliO [Isosphaeraceae bacterium]
MTIHPRIRLATSGVRALILLSLLAGFTSPGVRADRPPPTASIGSPSPVEPERRKVRPREAVGVDFRRTSVTSGGTGTWWFGTAGVALALAACGWASVAAGRFRAGAGAGGAVDGLRVVGKTALSPKHSVYLLRAGDRVLIVGTGPQGAPSLLGEMPPRAQAPGTADPPTTAPRRIDYRVGDGE